MMNRYISLIIVLLVVTAATGLASDIRTKGKFVSETTGEPPLEVASAGLVSNLNAERLGGFTVSDFGTAGSGAAVHWKNITSVPGKAIDQDCAIAGCFTDDDPGFPVTIANPGNYRLEGNLDVSAESTPEDVTAIEITVPGVTLDLGGFAILGPMTCTGTPVTSCSFTSGAGIGVSTLLGSPGTVIRNGTIKGMGQRGIWCEEPCLVERVTATENRRDGIRVTAYGILESNFAFRNGEDGIEATGVIRANVAEGNGSQGIAVGAGSNVVENVARQNGGHGLSASLGAVVRGNTSIGNTGNGAICPTCLLVDNNLYNNAGFGVILAQNPAYGRNLIDSNSNGAVSLSGGPSVVEVDTNACDGSSTC